VSRLPLSFALALGAGLAYFGTLGALTSVRVALSVPTVPHVRYLTVTLAISPVSDRRPLTICRCLSVFYSTQRPPLPALEITPVFVEMFDQPSMREVREFDPRE